MRVILILAATLRVAHGACISVNAPNIMTRDLAAAVPLFAQIDPEISIEFTPYPGTQRVLSSHELLTIATRFGLSFPVGERAPSLCVQRAVHLLSATEVRPVLLAGLGIPDVQMEILEISAQPVPPGQLEFRREGLNQPRSGDPQIPVIWRGRLVYDGRHSLAIWVKVRVAVNRETLVAAQEIPAGTVIGASQVQNIMTRRFPTLESSSNSQLTIRRTVGMVARRTFVAGETIVLAGLEAAKDVKRGQTVRVLVVDGGATISLDGVAESSGNKGETIIIRNPSSGRNFRALVKGPRQVVVRPTPGGAL